MGFKPIYVSLNGIGNADELRSVVLSQSLVQGAFTENKTVADITQRFSKMVAKTSIVKALQPSDLVILDKAVIFLDDIERISSSFKIEDALGCINSEYVEHKGIKVILVGDESKNQLDHDMYKNTKEKLIGWTIKYEPDLRDSLTSIKKHWKNDSSKIKTVNCQ